MEGPSEPSFKFSSFAAKIPKTASFNLAAVSNTGVRIVCPSFFSSLNPTRASPSLVISILPFTASFNTAAMR